MPELVLPYKPEGDQINLYAKKRRFLVAPVGRQYGKSTIGQLRDFKHTWGNPDANHYTIYPVYRQAKVQFKRLLRKFGDFITTYSMSDLSVRLLTGGQIQYFGSGDFENIKGDTLTSARIDECGKVHPDVWFEVVRPMLAVTKGRCDFMGTPKGKNWFHDLAQLAKSGHPDWSYHHAPSNRSPFFPQEEFEQARLTTPQMIFEQEYLAIFLDSGSEVFRNYKDCIAGELEQPEPGRLYVMGVDIAKHVDWTVITVWDVERRHMVGFERFNQIDWPLIEAKILEVSRKYNRALIRLDATGVGDPIYDRLSRNGANVVPIKITAPVKSHLIEALVMAIEKREITFPHIPDLVHELSIFTASKTPSGHVKYEAPAGYHDDIVLSMALALMDSPVRPTFHRVK